MNRVSRRSAAEQADALLEAGRTEPVLDYDVELGLARHQSWLRSDVPMPEWASAGVQVASSSFMGLVIKTIVSSVVVGALATAGWQARNLLQPSAAVVRPSSPGVVATQPADVPEAAEPEVEAAMAPIPIPLSDQPAASEPALRRDKRARRAHRAPKEGRLSAHPALKGATPSEAVEDDVAAVPEVAVAAHVEPERKPAGTRQKARPAQAAKPQQPADLVEMQQVATAEQLLERSPARALELVRQGDQRFARGYFQQERAYIAIMALIRLGRFEEARARATSFAKEFPALPYGARIRAALEAAP